MKKEKKIKKNNKGFTLIEIIGVVVIIGFITVIGTISVRGYIENSKMKTYESYKKDLAGASKDMLIDCMSNNEEDCVIPEYGNDLRIGYQELVDKGYSNRLKDPEGDGYCDRSYVIAKNKSENGVDIEYQVCLYCDKYKSEENGCQEINIDDNVPPTCGEVKGESEKWSKDNKVITVGCKDTGSGCIRKEYSKSIGKDGQVIKVSNITIEDKAGNKTSCPVKAYVDKKAPTCKIEVEGTSVGGWYKTGVKAKITNIADEGSGVLTSGIGTSLINRDYNGKTSYEVTGGIVTVFGYVKDKVGNEGYCSKEVKVDNTNPTGIIYMGYEAYPKENTSKDGNIITINNLSKYGTIEGVIVYFDGVINSSVASQVYDSSSRKITESGGIVEGNNKGIIMITPGSYTSLKIYLDNSTYITNIKKVEVLKKENKTSVWTNKNVSVYVKGSDTITGVGSYSYDGGITYGSTNIKSYESNTEGTIYVKDQVGNISNRYSFTINKIDKKAPSQPNVIFTKSSGGQYNTGTWSNQPITSIPSESKDNADGTPGVGGIYYRYKTGGASSVNEARSITKIIRAQGISSIQWQACDELGNCSGWTTKATVKVDTTPPSVPTVTFTKSNGESYTSGNWTNENVTSTHGVSWDNADGTTGVGGIYYKYETGGATGKVEGQARSVTIQAEGESSIKWQACDKLNNCSDWTTIDKVKIDTTPPSQPTVTFTKSNGETYTPGIWSNKTVTSKAAGSTDNGISKNGVISYQYTTDGINIKNDDKKDISTDGTSSIQWRACDELDNCSGWTTKATVKVDTTAPKCILTASGDQRNGWYIGKVTISFASAKDTVSGVASYKIRDENKNTIILTSDTKSKTYTGYIEDNAGNSNTCEIKVKRDATAPTLTIENPTGGNWTNKDFSLTLKSEDRISGLSGYAYSYDDISYSPYDDSAKKQFTTTPFSMERNQTVYIRACDKAGNCIVKDTQIKIDKTPPTMDIKIPKLSQTGDNGASLMVNRIDLSSPSEVLDYSYNHLYCIQPYNGNMTIKPDFTCIDDKSVEECTYVATLHNSKNTNESCLRTAGENPCVYVIEYIVEDDAGNRTSKKINYAIDYPIDQNDNSTNLGCERFR